MILCVTPSPAVDRTARVDRLSIGPILRPGEVIVLPGGKGANVARAVRALGGLAMTTGFAGGHAGRWLVEALEAEGLNPRFAEVTAETRTTYVIIDGGGRSLLVYEPMAAVSEAESARLLDLLARDLLPAASWVAVCGSAAAADASLAARIVAAARAAGRPCLVDTGGPALAAALAERPSIVKVARDEAASVAGGAGGGAGGSTAALAEALVALGAGLAIVTDGPRGAAASDGRSTRTVDVPRVRAVDAIGSGDAFTAGLLVALDGGRTIDEALVWAAAAGAANAETPGAGRLDPGRQEELAEAVRVRAARAARRRAGAAT